MLSLQKILEKRKRYYRHAASVLRYSTFHKLQNLVKVEWQRVRQRERVTGLPYITVLDPTNVCNLKCPVCPTTKGELLHPNGRIQAEQYQQLIDRIAPHTYRLILYNWGEPFLHRQIIDMLSYAHVRKISTSISSNLNLLPREGAQALVASGLDDLIVSCDGLSQETYERYRVGGDLEKLVTNMRAIAEAKKILGRSNPNIEFQFLVFQHNEHEVDQVRDFARENGADTFRLVKPAIDLALPDIRPAENPAYTRAEYQSLPLAEPAPLSASQVRDAEKPQSEPVRQPKPVLNHPEKPRRLEPIDCYWPWRVLTVNWNGEIDPCCYHNQLGSFGNIFSRPLDEVFNNEKFVYARRRITGQASSEGFDDVLCKECKGYTV